MSKTLKIVCYVLLIIGLLSFAYPVLAQGRGGPQSNFCREGRGNCEYPGECHDYIDSNNDGHCDRVISSSQTGTSNTAPSGSTSTVDNTVINSGTNNTASVPAATSATDAGGTANTTTSNGAPDNSSRYNFLLLLFSVVIAYGATYLLSVKNVISTLLHRKIWNVVLLISGVAMLILGLLLTLREEFHWDIQLPFDLTYWHVETGIVMGLIAAFHIAWHWRYFTRLLKPADNGYK